MEKTNQFYQQHSKIRSRDFHYRILSILVAFLLFAVAFYVPVQAAAKPGTVKLTKITATDYNKINIKWKKASGATNYIVYYRKNGVKKWTKIKTLDNTKSSYTHTSSSKYPIAVGQKYQYTVKAYNSKTKKFGSNNTKGLVTYTVPETVKNIKVTYHDDVDPYVSISWDKAKGATSYIVYFRDKNNTEWLSLKTTKNTNCVDVGPYFGYNNKYTVRSYANRVYGKYDTAGVSVYVPKQDDDIPDTPEPTATPKPTEKPQPTVTPKPTTKPQPTATPTPNPVHRPDQAEINQMVQEVIRLTNIERAKVGSAPLQYHEGLQKAAMVRAKELDTLFSHTRPDGRDSSTALYDNGVGGSAGENIAMGYKSAADVVEGWMESPGHRTALLSEGETHIGVGFYQNEYGTYFWTQNFSNNPDKKCTITLNADGGLFNDGNEICVIQVPYGMYVNFKTDIPLPTRDGYTLKGWKMYNIESDIGMGTLGMTIAKLTAVWITN